MRNVSCAMIAALVLVLGSVPPAQAWGYGGHYGHGGYHGYGGHYGYGGRPGHHGHGGYYSDPAYGYGYAARSNSYSVPDVEDRQPVTYVQREFSWYYCENAKAYYPSVPQCPGGWITVAPPTGSPGQ